MMHLLELVGTSFIGGLLTLSVLEGGMWFARWRRHRRFIRKLHAHWAEIDSREVLR